MKKGGQTETTYYYWIIIGYWEGAMSAGVFHLNLYRSVIRGTFIVNLYINNLSFQQLSKASSIK